MSQPGIEPGPRRWELFVSPKQVLFLPLSFKNEGRKKCFHNFKRLFFHIKKYIISHENSTKNYGGTSLNFVVLNYVATTFFTAKL